MSVPASELEPFSFTVDLPGVTVPIELNRPPLYDGSQRPALDTYAVAGARVRDDWGTEITDANALEELNVVARHPQDRAPYIVLGLVDSSEGFLNHNVAFSSLGDMATRNWFRVIADTIQEDAPPGQRPSYYNPLLTARRALSLNVEYQDGCERHWDRDEVYSHLVLAFAERGSIFPPDEHLDKSIPHLYSAAITFTILRAAYDYGHQDLGDEINASIKKLVAGQFMTAEQGTKFSWDPRYLVEIAAKANELAGAELISVSSEAPLV